MSCNLQMPFQPLHDLQNQHNLKSLVRRQNHQQGCYVLQCVDVFLFLFLLKNNFQKQVCVSVSVDGKFVFKHM